VICKLAKIVHSNKTLDRIDFARYNAASKLETGGQMKKRRIPIMSFEEKFELTMLATLLICVLGLTVFSVVGWAWM